VKKHLGRYRLRLDFNRAWSLDQALRFAKHFSPNDFEYLEEPVNTFADLVRFSTLTQFPIAADESLRQGSYLEIPTLKATIVKPTLMGTIPTLPPHLSLVLSSSYESSLGILQIARLANSPIPQGLDTFTDDLLIPPLRVENGCLTWTPSSTPIDFTKLCLIASAP
jgi:O-succinylbenzoate synthase